MILMKYMLQTKLTNNYGRNRAHGRHLYIEKQLIMHSVESDASS
jgi:hypothetical protein